LEAAEPYIGRNLSEVIGKTGLDIKISGDLNTVAKKGDVIVDFTSPSSTVLNLAAAKKAKVPIVVGTTGLTDEEEGVAKSASRFIPVLLSANMSVGINLLFRIAPEIANLLGEDYNIEIIEAHHNKKKDSPSGTAKTLSRLIAEARGRLLEKVAVYGRKGKTGERDKKEIGIHAVRAGDIVGDHTVIYAGDNERVEITHRAHSRDVFARGALSAAAFLADKSPGLYSMQDVLKGV
jgi:dihydrodipicolinate reductase